MHLVFEGPDGVGKSTLIDAVIQRCEKKGVVTGSEERDFDAPYAFVEEPSRDGVGRVIREVLLRGDYSAETLANCFSADRYVQLQEFTLPYLQSGGSVVQSRSFLSTLVYQSVQGKSVDSLLALPGNTFASMNAPDKVIVPYVHSVDTLIDRLNGLGEEEDVFEKAVFQKKVLEVYRSGWFDDLCAQYGVDVIYVDVSCGVEDAVRRTLRCVHGAGFFAEDG